MIARLKQLLGFETVEDRRQFGRFALNAPLVVTAGSRTFDCRLVDVSAGGVRMEPAIGLRIGEAVSVLHPGSGLSLDGCVVGRNGETTRVSFDSPDAAVVVAVWVRMTNEAALPPKKA